MEKEKIKQLLNSFGFSEWETQAYLALLKHGAQTALELSRVSKIARSKTYEVVTRLRRKGFVMKVPPMPTKGSTQKFVAINPEKVFSSKITDMKELSNQLKTIYNNPLRARFPNINFYTSKEAVKELFFNISKKSKFFYFYLVDTNFEKILGCSLNHFLRQIKKKKHCVLLREEGDFQEFIKNLKEIRFHNERKGINYLITSESIILDLWNSQHIIIEINSTEAVETFLFMYGKTKSN